MLRFLISLTLLSDIFAQPIKINLITTNDMHGFIGDQKGLMSTTTILVKKNER